MKLHLLRHGHAHSVSEAKVRSDAERPLSAAGRTAVKRMAEELKRRGAAPELLLHSPLRRAVETAEVAAGVLKPKAVELFPPLANTLAAAPLFERVGARAEGLSELLLVGHQPQLGDLASLLAGAPFLISPGGLVSLRLDGGEAAVLWTCNPEDFSS